MRKSRLVFFGNERLATGVTTVAPTLQRLIQAGYEVRAVISNYSQGRSRHSRGLEIAELAKKHNIPLILPAKLSEIKTELANYDAEVAFLVAYGRIIPPDIIDIFPRGIINLHPSLLPKFRGPSPIETTILDDADKTGVSIMKLIPEMDAGPVYARAELKLSGDETKQQLADQLLELGGQLLLEHLSAILDGSAKAKEQDHTAATYTELISKDAGLIDWQKPAEQLEREIRAYAGWPRSRAKIHGQDVIVTKSRVAKDEKDGDLIIKCQPGWLEIQEVVAPSGKTMTGVDYQRGYQK